ncbi:hypothetical protein Tco_1311674 [Tanacetum coccineum]
MEDMLLCVVQLKGYSICDGECNCFDFIMGIRMFTRSIISRDIKRITNWCRELLRRSLTSPTSRKTFPESEFKEPYTPSYDPPGIIYEDLNKQKRVLRADELYKFSDGTLKSVRDEMHHRVLDFHLDYNPEMPKRKWTSVGRKRSGNSELDDKLMMRLSFISRYPFVGNLESQTTAYKEVQIVHLDIDLVKLFVGREERLTIHGVLQNRMERQMSARPNTILLEKHGNAIQANMGIHDMQHDFDQLLEQDAAYQIWHFNSDHNYILESAELAVSSIVYLK